ncbi:MAG TPA: hypothetical protein VI230_02940, partial [Ignavibacteriaceae bacterium]
MRLRKLLLNAVLSMCLYIYLTGTAFSQALSGSYTIGGNSPDYLTLQDAANALQFNGVSGPVVFNLRPGVYMKDNGAVCVMLLDTVITGNTAENRITFQPDAASGGNVGNVILQTDFDAGSDFNARQIIKVGSDYTTFSNLTFRDADSLDAPARWFIRVEGITFWNETVEGLIVDGCRFMGTPYYPQGQQYGSDYGIYSSHLATGTVKNNRFSNLMRAVGLDVETGGVGSDPVTIEDNKFDHLYFGVTGSGNYLGSAIEVEFVKAYIRRNFVSDSHGAVALNIVYPVIAYLESNYVNGSYQSELSLGLNSASQDRADSVIIFNNIIIGPGDGGSFRVFTRNTRIFHNTILNLGGNVGLWISADNCQVINNILKASSNTITEYDFFGSDGIVSNYNVFYKGPGQWFFAHDVAGNYYTNFDSYRTATGLDSNSSFTDVQFEFDSLGLHLNECQSQNSALDGIHLDEVPFDFYGAYRDSVKPFIGAVEGVRIPFDMFGDPYRTALTGFPLSVAAGNLDNADFPGIAVPDWDNRRVNLFHNNAGTRTFTQIGSVQTVFKPTAVRFYDLDEDSHQDLIVAGDTAEASLEVFWGDGSGGFSGPDIVETA